jgi:hypothetical protein
MAGSEAAILGIAMIRPKIGRKRRGRVERRPQITGPAAPCVLAPCCTEEQ